MRRRIIGALGIVLAVGLTLGASISPAAQRASGPESFRGVLVASGESGARTVTSSLIVTRGVFTGVGTIVEVPNWPGDSDAVTRDDLVFPQGKMHNEAAAPRGPSRVDRRPRGATRPATAC